MFAYSFLCWIGVIRSHYGHGFLKQYVRDRFLLRTESATNNVADYGVKKAVVHLPELRHRLSPIVDNYLNVQQDILETFVDRGQLRWLSSTHPAGKRQTHPRPQAGTFGWDPFFTIKRN